MAKRNRLAAAKVLKPVFRASLRSDGVLEMTVYEEIGENFWTGGGVTAQTVKQQIDYAGNYSRIALRINSPGGDAFEGVAIKTVLRAQNKPIDVFIDGIAASAASIIAMAGDSITMASGSMMMIHEAWSMCMGNADDMTKMADTLQKVSESIAQVYVDRTGKSMDDILALMKAETWMNAQDCLDQGFATAISKYEDRSAMALAHSFKALIDGQKFALRNVPSTLRNDDLEDDAKCLCDCQACLDGNCQACMHDGCACEGCDCPWKDPGNDPGEQVDPAEQAKSNLSLFQARAAMLLRRQK